MTLDDIEYTHRLSNFIEAKEHAFKLIALLKGAVKLIDGQIDIDVGSVLSNIGSPDMSAIESYIIKYTTAKSNGSEIRLSNDIEINKHFNEHRSHYVKLIIDGVKFHFADFLPGGVGFVKNMNPTSVVA